MSEADQKEKQREKEQEKERRRTADMSERKSKTKVEEKNRHMTEAIKERITTWGAVTTLCPHCQVLRFEGEAQLLPQ